jgi:hypothetical protein
MDCVLSSGVGAAVVAEVFVMDDGAESGSRGSLDGLASARLVVIGFPMFGCSKDADGSLSTAPCCACKWVNSRVGALGLCWRLRNIAVE